MINLRAYTRLLTPVAAVMSIAFSSCNNTPEGTPLSLRTTLEQPVTQPLQLGAAEKLNLNAIKSVQVHPDIKSFDIDKLPVKPYDTGAVKPEKYRPETRKFDFAGLPSRPFDVDKLPTVRLKFKLYKIRPPKLIKAGARRLINSHMAVFELGEAQGLKADSINTTYTDRDGFIWIGTNRGLYRYDGENFWFFDDLPQKRTILYIEQDKQGLLWLGTFDGYLEILDVTKGIVKTIDAKNTTGKVLMNQTVTDDRERIWTATWSGGISIIDLQHQTISNLSTKDGLPGNNYSSIALDADHNIWMGSKHHGLVYLDLKNKAMKYVDSTNGLKTNRVSTMLFDRKGQLWVGQDDGTLDIIDVEHSMVKTINERQGAFYTSFNVVFTMMQDKQGRIWTGRSGNGIEVIDPGNQTRLYLHSTLDPSGQYVINLNQDKRGQIWSSELAKLHIIETDHFILDEIGHAPTTSLFEDHNGLIWRAGDFDGVEIIDRQKKTVRLLNATNGLEKDTMGFLRERDGKMLITDNQNLYTVDQGRHTIRIMGEKQGFFSSIRAWAFDKKGRMWLGGITAGIEIYYPANNEVKILGKKEGIRNGDIEDMCADSTGRIWISTFRAGIGVIDPDKGTINYIDNADLKGQQERMLADDPRGNVWATDSKGLYKLDLANKLVTVFGRRQGLADKEVINLLINNDKIYAGGAKGVAVITPPRVAGKNNNWQVEPLGAVFEFDRKNGDPQSDAITRDGLYVKGDMGVAVLNLAARDTFDYPAYITGIKILDSARYFTAGQAAKADGMSWNGAAGAGNIPVDLHLPYNKNFVQFNYSIVNVARHDTVYYKYRLLGIDKTWSNPTDETSTHNYINLDPGKYVFEVTGLGYNKAWTRPAVVSFTIDPPWWQTWWAYLFYVVLLGGSIWGFSHYRSLQLIKDKRVLEHKVHIRTEEVLRQKEEIEAQRDNLDKAFMELKETQSQLVQREKMASLGELTAGIAHEIQNPLNFVNNFSEVSAELIGEMQAELKAGDKDEAIAISEDVKQNLEKIRHHGKRADAIVKGMLQHSQSGSGLKEPTNINALADEYLRLSYHGLRSKDKSFNAEMLTHFDEKLPLINVIPQDIGRVMLNLFNNAFYAVHQKSKTAGEDYNPEVSVSTSTESSQVVIRVKDNGIGIPEAIKDKIMQPFFTTKPTGEGTGLGLSLIYDMVVKGHGGSIAVNTKEREFTEFIVSLPL